MRKSRFTEEQIIAVLTQQERGMSTADSAITAAPAGANNVGFMLK